MIEVRLAQGAREIEQCLRLRWTVFVEEQGVRPSDELDALDHGGAIHALASLDGVPCGAARFVFTAGACPLDQTGAIMCPGEVVGQAEHAMANLVSALLAAGAKLSDVVKTTVLLSGPICACGGRCRVRTSP